MPGAEDLDLDVVFDLLSETRRRCVLYYLLDHQRASLEELSPRIAAAERDVSVESVTEADERAVAASLIHKHLPRLNEHGIVDYDHRNGDVVATDEFERLRHTVERARASDSAEISANRSSSVTSR